MKRPRALPIGLVIAVVAFASCVHTGCIILGGTVAVVLSRSLNTDELALHDGWLEENLPYRADNACAAAVDVMKANKIAILEENLTGSGCVVRGEYGDGIGIEITISDTSESECAVNVRVGPEGNVERSVHIVDMMRAFLE